MGGLEVITIVTNYSIANLQLIDTSVITKLLVDRGDILTLPRTSKTSNFKTHFRQS